MSSLSGLRIAVTRPAAQSRELTQLLEAAGAQVLACPLIKVEPRVVDVPAIDEYDWVVLTSVNGVDLLLRALAAHGTGTDVLRRRARIAAVGPATAAALHRHGLTPDAIPNEYVGEAVAAAMAARESLSGRRVLLARATGGGEALPTELRRRGAEVDDLELYRSVLDADGAARLKSAVSAREIDVITFTSGSAVTYFAQTIGASDGIVVAVIGPSTAEVARQHALPVEIEASVHTAEGLVTAITAYYAAKRG